MHKLATVHPYTFNRLVDTIAQGQSPAALMIELGEHFRVPEHEAEKLFEAKLKSNRGVPVVVSPWESRSRYVPDTGVVYTNGQPWSFLHEYGHAEADSPLRTVQKLVARNRAALSEAEKDMLNKYVVDAYMTGENGRGLTATSAQTGNYMLDVVGDLRTRKTKDAWRLSEELINNAKAYNLANDISGKDIAYRVHQPLVVSDVTYAGSFYPDKLQALMKAPRHSAWHPSNLVSAPWLNKVDILGNLHHKLNRLQYGMPKDWETFRTAEGEI